MTFYWTSGTKGLNVIIALGQATTKKKKVSISSDKFFDEQAFPDLFPKGKFGKHFVIFFLRANLPKILLEIFQ